MISVVEMHRKSPWLIYGHTACKSENEIKHDYVTQLSSFSHYYTTME